MATSTGVLILWWLMSVDHGDLAVKAEAPFLHVHPGHFVIVAGDQLDQGAVCIRMNDTGLTAAL